MANYRLVRDGVPIHPFEADDDKAASTKAQALSLRDQRQRDPRPKGYAMEREADGDWMLVWGWAPATGV